MVSEVVEVCGHRGAAFRDCTSSRLPVALCPIPNQHRACHHQKLRRTPTASEWSRFNFYARRIRRLGYCSVEHNDLAIWHWYMPATFANRKEILLDSTLRLVLSRRARWILPNLESIRWIFHREAMSMDLIPLFLGPKVTSFTFGHLLCEHNSNPALLDQYTLPHLYTMVAICPTLTQLELHMKKHNVALANAAAAFAYDTYPRLECFVVEGVDPWPEHFLQYLAGLPYLRGVHLTLDDGQRTTWASSTLRHRTSPSRHCTPFNFVSLLSLHALISSYS